MRIARSHSLLSIYNRNKHEKRKGHGPQLQGKPKILSIGNLYYCPTNGCTVKSKYKANIVKHLKLCVKTKEKWNTPAKNKSCPVCQKALPQKWNHDRHMQNAHQSLEDDIVDIDDMLNNSLPSMVLADDVPTKIFQSCVIPENPVNNTNQEETVLLPIDDDPSRRNEMKRKQSSLEKTVTKIKMQLGYWINVSESVLEKLKRDLKDNKKGATKFINDCFGEMLDGKGFIGWLANGTQGKSIKANFKGEPTKQKKQQIYFHHVPRHL